MIGLRHKKASIFKKFMKLNSKKTNRVEVWPQRTAKAGENGDETATKLKELLISLYFML